ncbi:excisionase family DNA-binding protein [Kocuria sp. CH-021]|uniref:excisionase family DNA-binding protein n=1 Tax=Kocuria sp. CH-021 TaxID=3406735 RepID=UPI003C7612BA
MKTISATSVNTSELNQLNDVVREFPEDSVLKQAVEQVSNTVHAGQDVVVAPESDYITPAMAAKLIGVSRVHLYKVLDAGDLAYIMVGRDRRIALGELRDYMIRQDKLRKQVAERFAHPEATRAAAMDELDV